MRLLLLLACLTLAVAAQERPITIRTDPPTYIYQFKGAAGWDYKGRSGTEIRLDTSVNSSAMVGFRYFKGAPTNATRAPQAQQKIEFGDFEKRVFPPTGVYHPNLSPEEMAEYTHDVRVKRLCLAAGLVGLAAAGFGAVFLRLRQLKARDERLAELVPQTSEDRLIGSKVGKYMLVSKLGRGGMATVYKAVPRDTLDESQAVAVKMVEILSMDPESEQRFQREWKVCVELTHPHIVKLLDFGQEGEYRYLVMELVHGETLRSQVSAQGLPPHRAYRLLAPVMSALAYSHDKGIVHRDLKPENVMLSYGANRAEPRVLVMDFGLARSHHFETVTATGNVLGTPAYMAPEQINGQWQAASDQYALGVMAYELLTGKRPFDFDDPIQIILAHLQQEPQPPRVHKPSLPPRLDALVMRMLAKEPQKRFATMSEVLEAWPPELRSSR